MTSPDSQPFLSTSSYQTSTPPTSYDPNNASIPQQDHIETSPELPPLPPFQNSSPRPTLPPLANRFSDATAPPPSQTAPTIGAVTQSLSANPTSHSRTPPSNTIPSTRLQLNASIGVTQRTRVAALPGRPRKQRGGRKPRVADGIQKSRRKNSVQSGGRGSGFTRQEVDRLLKLLEEHLPLAKEEWDHVLRLHEERYPDYNRTVDSLKRKFASLHRRKVPTGDPTIPPDVEKAKRIRYSMAERADIGEGEDSDDVLCAFESDDEGRETKPLDEELTDTDRINSSDGTRENTPINLHSPAMARPLVRKRGSKEAQESSTAELIELYKLQMMQDQARRNEEKETRALEREEEKKWRQELREDRIRREAERHEDRKERALERDQERAARAEESKRHERFMDMFMMSLAKM